MWAKRGAGKLVVMGSAQVFDDKWLDKEENSKLMDFVFKFLKPVSRPPLLPNSWAAPPPPPMWNPSCNSAPFSLTRKTLPPCRTRRWR